MRFGVVDFFVGWCMGVYAEAGGAAATMFCEGKVGSDDWEMLRTCGGCWGGGGKDKCVEDHGVLGGRMGVWV